MTEELSSSETADRVKSYLEEHPVASVREIGRELGVGRETARRAVRRLLAEGRVGRERRGTSRGYPTRYGEAEDGE